MEFFKIEVCCYRIDLPNCAIMDYLCLIAETSNAIIKRHIRAAGQNLSKKTCEALIHVVVRIEENRSKASSDFEAPAHVAIRGTPWIERSDTFPYRER
jgi:hypothetical protein